MQHQITVAKITEEEVNELQNFLTTTSDKFRELDNYDIDCEESNEEIGKLVRGSFPGRAALVSVLNLRILLDNYQDKESEILQHPKWIKDIYSFLEDLDKHISTNVELHKDLGFHERLKKLLE